MSKPKIKPKIKAKRHAKNKNKKVFSPFTLPPKTDNLSSMNLAIEPRDLSELEIETANVEARQKRLIMASLI
ncbi:MAG: hypothetical protein LBV23_08065 [Deltaproteobacteria bacterium]|jgi:hypothetical protein|nr:hypothetical protein [Deltaproteobacteria bacterium]